MTPIMKKLFEKYRENGFSDFKGLEIDATIPITEAVLNEAVQDIRAMRDGNVQHLRISIRDRNTLNVDLRLKWGFISKTFKFDAIVGEQIDFQATPQLVIALSGSGLSLAILAHIANLILDFLPNGIDIMGKNIEVNIGTMLSDRGLDNFMPLLKFVRIETIPGKLILRLGVEVN